MFDATLSLATGLHAAQKRVEARAADARAVTAIPMAPLPGVGVGVGVGVLPGGLFGVFTVGMV